MEYQPVVIQGFDIGHGEDAPVLFWLTVPVDRLGKIHRGKGCVAAECSFSLLLV